MHEVTTQLCRGMVLCRNQQGSNEACIVMEPAKSPIAAGAFTVVHGYLDESPMCGLFEVWPKDVPNVWRRATPNEAAKVRELFIAHAKAWGLDSHGWVAQTIPADESPSNKELRIEFAREGEELFDGEHADQVAVMTPELFDSMVQSQRQFIGQPIPTLSTEANAVLRGPILKDVIVEEEEGVRAAFAIVEIDDDTDPKFVEIMNVEEGEG